MSLTQVTSAGLKDGEIVNADLHSSAAIALSKLATSGTAGSGNYLRGDGAWTAIDLTALSASNLTSGTVAAARLDAATTQSAGNSSTKIATTAFVSTAVTNLIGGAPGALDTLNELAAAINDDSSYASTVTTALATKAVLTGSTNNTIATVTGANALQGEANLTFDGSNLNVVDGGAIIGGGSDNDVLVRLDHEDNTGKAELQLNAWGSASISLISNFSGSTVSGVPNGAFGLTTPHAKDIIFGTSGTERLRITSDGLFGFGTLTPSSKVQIQTHDHGAGSAARGHHDLLELKHPNTHTTGDGPALLLNGYYSNAEWKYAKISSENSGSGYGAKFKIYVHPANGSQGANLVEALNIVGDGGSRAYTTIQNHLVVTNSSEGYVQVCDERGGSYKARFLMAGSGPVIRNENTNTSDNTLIVQKGSNNKFVIDGNGYITKPSQPSCMAYNAQGQMIGGGQIATFNSTRINNGSNYNSSNGRFTAPIAGQYLVAYSGLHDKQSGSDTGFEIRINNGAFDGGEGYCNAVNQNMLAKTIILNMSANDYVSIYLRNASSRLHQRYGSLSVSLLN